MRTQQSIAVTLVACMLTTAVAAASLAPGTLLNGTITQDYSSNHAYVGERVELTNVTNDDGSGTVTRGRLYGQVVAVQPAGQGTPGKIRFHFSRLVLANGAVYAVDSHVTGVQANTKSNAAKEAGGAIAGMLVGNAIGKTLFHVGGFGLLGAAGGFLLAKNNRQNVDVPAGSVVQVELTSVTRRQSS
ncbi:MAG TPA: hypothetical protein VMD47_10725 [Candidatus Acidoferrales bacterium]|nr:hypothetical protein [Candidatus Acidoferrales bacterium]